MYCDASDCGLGSALVQEEKIIGLYSYKFSDVQRRYPTAEKELFAVIKSLAYFKPIIFNNKVIIFSDHKNFLNLPDSKNARIQRWALLLTEFIYEIKYIEGKENSLADYLSRIEICNETQRVDFKFPLKEKDILEYQQRSNDKKLKNINFKNTTQCFKVNDKFYIPTEISFNLIQNFHFKLGHPGNYKMTETLREIYFISNLESIDKKITSGCEYCIKNKPKTGIKEKELGKLSIDNLWEKIYLDILGLLDGEFYGHKDKKFWLLTITESCSRWIEICILYDLFSCTIISHLYVSWINRYPTPSYIHTDKGTCFTSNDFKDFCLKQNIKHTTTKGYNPTGNAIAERNQGTILTVLKTYKGFQLEEVVGIAAMKIRFTMHKTIKTTPSSLVFGCNKFHPNIRFDTKALLTSAQDNFKKTQKESVKRKNLKRKTTNWLGTLVYRKSKEKGKLDDMYEGPWEVIEVHDDNGLVKLKYDNVIVDEKMVNLKMWKKKGSRML